MSIQTQEFAPTVGSHHDLETRRDLFELLMSQVDCELEDEQIVMNALHTLANSPVDVEFVDHCMRSDPTLRLEDLGYVPKAA